MGLRVSYFCMYFLSSTILQWHCDQIEDEIVSQADTRPKLFVLAGVSFPAGEMTSPTRSSRLVLFHLFSAGASPRLSLSLSVFKENTAVSAWYQPSQHYRKVHREASTVFYRRRQSLKESPHPNKKRFLKSKKNRCQIDRCPVSSSTIERCA